jgi:hypothetical protein
MLKDIHFWSILLCALVFLYDADFRLLVARFGVNARLGRSGVFSSRKSGQEVFCELNLK